MLRKTSTTEAFNHDGPSKLGLTDKDQEDIRWAYEEISRNLNKSLSLGKVRIQPSPTKVANHCLLTDSAGDPRFSVEQVAAVLSALPQVPVPKQQVTQWSVDITPVHGAQAPLSQAETLSRTAASTGRTTQHLSRASASATTLQEQFLNVNVGSTAQALFVTVSVSEYTSVDEVIAQLPPHCKTGYLAYVHPDNGQNFLIRDDTLLHQVISNKWACVFQSVPHSPARPESPATTLLSRQLFQPVSSPELSTDPPESLDRVNKLQSYEITLQRSIAEVVTEAIRKQPLGKTYPLQARTVSETVKALNLLSKRWDTIVHTAQSRRDSVSLRQRLHWFLGKVLDLMDPVLFKKWSTQAPRELREVETYSSWAEFQQQLFRLIASEVRVPPEDLLADLPGLMGSVMDYSDITYFVATLNDFRFAGHEFLRLRGAPESARETVDKHVRRYLLTTLVTSATEALHSQLASIPEWRATVEPFYQAQKFPPVEAYPLDTLLDALLERAQTRPSAHWHADFLLPRSTALVRARWAEVRPR